MLVIEEKLIGNCRFFCLPEVLCKQGNQEVPQNQYEVRCLPKDECQERRHDYERMYCNCRQPVRAIQIMAQGGMLDRYFSKKIIKEAKKSGKLPKGYQVHHIIPIKLGGSNELNNLCIVDAETHTMLHRFIYQPLLEKLREGETAFVKLPLFERVLYKEDRDRFFLHKEVRSFKKENDDPECIRQQRPWDNRNSDMGCRDAFMRSSRH